ncbi:MAG: DUF2283 domain-containing protein [Leptolyngbyaceae cyanobacterium]
MKFHYYPETDSLYIGLTDKPSADSQEVAVGIVLDFDSEGHLVGIDIDRASQVVDLSRLEAESLPISAIALANATQAS